MSDASEEALRGMGVNPTSSVDHLKEPFEIPHIAADRDFRHMIELCNELLTRKGADYTQGAEGDRGRLKNFYESSKRLGISPLQVLATYMNKHQMAIETFIQTGRLESEAIEGRIADLINYLLLLYKMIAYEKREAVQVPPPQPDYP